MEETWRTCELLVGGRVGDGGCVLGDGAHVGLRCAAGRGDGQRSHQHPGLQLWGQTGEQRPDGHYGPDCASPSHQGFKVFYFSHRLNKNTIVKQMK